MSRRSRCCPSCSTRIGFRRGLLLGHSDGASIAAIYAGGVGDHRVRGVVMIAPHFIVEDVSVGLDRGDQDRPMRPPACKAKLARWHRDVDNAFYGWNGAWLDPKFRSWDISEYLAYIRVPVAILQGADDQYGTIRQIEIAQGRMLLSGRCDDRSGRRTFAASRSAGGDAPCDLGIRRPHFAYA